MASLDLKPRQVGQHRTPRRRTRAVHVTVFVVMAVLFSAKISDYLAPQLLRPSHLAYDIKRAYDRVSFKIKGSPLFNHCTGVSRMVRVPGGYVCADGTSARSVLDQIYESAPISADARASIYDSNDKGSMSAANDLLAGKIQLPRFPAYTPAGPLTWNEDPLHSVYWRMNFYGLRPTLNLIYAYRKTGNSRYAKKLIDLDTSFFNAEDRSRYAWADDHAVAFRAMALTDAWWRLRQGHMLTERESQRFLVEIEKTATFLADPNHYQPQHNHGINEAAALLQIAVDFPHMPGAAGWSQLAKTRLDLSIHSLVDADGVLIENSPYYQFYVLDKLWQIDRWALSMHFSLSRDFHARLAQMIRYSTYVLQPDSSVPLLGASLQATIHAKGSFALMAASDPQFKYVLSHGAKGKVPRHTSVTFPVAGQTIMRSGWGKPSTFTKQSYLTFNVGPYRTTHSSLDALGITLYGNGTTLLPGPGLYTYTHGVMRNYFHGTSSHNTVVVDGKDQTPGSAVAGPLIERNGITYQSGEESLNRGVTHRRMVMMLDADHFLITDRISSVTPHTYQQMFHMFPGAKLTRNGLTVAGQGSRPGQSITISQVDTSGLSVGVVAGRMHPPAGICSQEYEVAVACPAVSYTQRGTNVQFTTLLTIGNAQRLTVQRRRASDQLTLADGRRSVTLTFSPSAASPEVAFGTHTKLPPLQGQHPIGTLRPDSWTVVGGPQAAAMQAGAESGIRLTTAGSAVATATPSHATYDGSAFNLSIRVRVSSVENLSKLDVEVSNGGWRTVMANNLRDVYTPRDDKEWLTISLGRGQQLTGIPGSWTQTGPGSFDWSAVDGVRLVLRGKDGAPAPVTVEVSQFQEVPAQASGRVAIVFDDGYQSILPAAAYLHQLGLPANVAVIGKYTRLPSQGHLTVSDLRRLQNSWGWNMANHSDKHVDGVTSYSHTFDLAGYEQDVVAGAQFLKQTGLNSAPNWFIYPHGDTDDGLKSVIGRLYKFARVTQNDPESFPYGDPLAVKNFEIQSAKDSEGGASGQFTTPAQVARAVADTRRFGNTLLLTFHRIHATPSDPPGYALQDFKTIAKDLKASGLPVLTLSQLDKSYGIPEDNEVQAIPATASQISVSVSVHDHRASRSLWSRLTAWL